MNGKDFLGRGLKFPLQIDKTTGKLAMVSGEEDIHEAIGIILRTNYGERVMRPSFGSNTMEYAFAPTSGHMTQHIIYDVRNAILDQERRITDLDVSCKEIDEHNGKLVIEVAYTVIQTNNRFNHVYPFYVTEGSEGGGAE